MTLAVRPAGAADVEAMVGLAEARRVELERLQPLFWRRAEASAAMSRAWFAHLLTSPEAAAFVAVEGDDRVGMLFARRTPAPPVYAPGETWTVDDFCVAAPGLWETAGAALLDAVRAHGRARGWAQLVVVGVAGDPEQTALLERAELSVASHWWTGAP